MWVFTEDGNAAINLDHCLLVYIKQSDVGFGVLAVKDRGDMGTLLKVCDSDTEARAFMNSVLASHNGRVIENHQH